MTSYWCGWSVTWIVAGLVWCVIMPLFGLFCLVGCVAGVSLLDARRGSG
jgi:hypothetical protein